MTPAISTSQDLATAIESGAVRSDCSASVFHVSKPIETDTAIAGLQVRAYPSGWLYGSEMIGTLTGRSCFAYSGRGAALEMTLSDGSIGWIADVRPADPAAFEATTNARRAEFYTAPEPDAIVVERYRWNGRFMGVRLPKHVRFIDARSEQSTDRIVSMITRPYSTSSSLSHYSDTRELGSASYSARLMRDLRVSLARMIRDYRKYSRQERAPRVRRQVAKHGGSPYYMPAIVVWNNYGYSIMTDPNRRALRPYDPIRTRRQRKARQS